MEEIQLDLRRHCVETEIRKLYNLALSAYFKPGADKPGLEARIGLLTLALEGFNFRALRGCYPDLCGGGTQPVVLFEDPDGVPQLRVGELSVDTTGKTGDRPKPVIRVTRN
jgi:hypothetical protein